MKLQNIHTAGRFIYLFLRDDSGKQIIEKVDDFYPYYYEPYTPELGNKKLYKTFDGKDVYKCTAVKPSDVRKVASSGSYESDITYPKRFLIDRVDEIESSPTKICMFDIEIDSPDEFPNPEEAKYPVSMIYAYNNHTKKLCYWGLDGYEGTKKSKENQLLTAFCNWVKRNQFDILTAWNMMGFDWVYLFNRCKKIMGIELSEYISPIGKSRFTQNGYTLPAGISVLCMMEMYAKLTLNRKQSYALDFTAQEALEEKSWGSHDFSDYGHTKEKCKCFDDETLILTDNGWKAHHNISYSDKVLSLDMKTGKSMYTQIDEIFVYDYEGDMFEYSNESFNFCVTPGHKMVFYNTRKDEYYKDIIDNYFRNSCTPYPIPRLIDWESEDISDFIIPARTSRKHFDTSEGAEFQYKTLIERKIPADTFIAFLGWYIAEGCCSLDSRTVQVAQMSYGKHYTEIEEIIRNMPYKYGKDKKGFRIYNMALIDWLLNNCYTSNEASCYNKKVPDIIKKASKRQIRIFIDAYYKGAAGVTSSWQLAQDIEELCLKAGYGSSIYERKPAGRKWIVDHYANCNSPCWEVLNPGFKTTKFRHLVCNKLRKIHYKGKVWCVSTTPHHTVFIKRRGKTLWSGNSDVKRLVKLDNKFDIFGQYDEVRRKAKVLWEDLPQMTMYDGGRKSIVSNNSKPVDQILLEVARKNNLILPRKPLAQSYTEQNKYLKEQLDKTTDSAKRREIIKKIKDGAFRKVYQKGRFKSLIALDLSSAYPSAIIDFCLDIANLSLTPIDNAVKVECTYRETGELRGIYYYRQNPNAILPTAARYLIEHKENIKKERNKFHPESEEYKTLDISYKAAKGLVNSLFGVCGLSSFRLFNKDIFNSITFLVRDLLHFVIDETQGAKLIANLAEYTDLIDDLESYYCTSVYGDTDGWMVDTNIPDIVEFINCIAQKWAQVKYGKEGTSIRFDYEGTFKPVFINELCHYCGHLDTGNGIEHKVKGMATKRSNTNKFVKKTVKQVLDMIIELTAQDEFKYNEDDVIEYLRSALKDVREKDIVDFAFPAKLSRKIENYDKKEEIYVRALKNTKEFGMKIPKIGEVFYWIHVKPYAFDEYFVDEYYRMVPGKRTGTTKQEKVKTSELNKMTPTEKSELKKITRTKKKAKDVVAFTRDNVDEMLRGKEIDWDLMIKKNIIEKVNGYFESLEWDVKKLEVLI